MKKTIFLFVLYITSYWTLGVAHAANWREVGEVPNTNITVFVDDNSLSVDHDTIVKGWVRFDYHKPREREGLMLTDYVSQRMVDCENNRYWITEGWGHSKGKPEMMQVFTSAQEWQQPVPDSEAEIASAALCMEAQSVLGKLWEKFQIAQQLQMAWRILNGVLSP